MSEADYQTARRSFAERTTNRIESLIDKQIYDAKLLKAVDAADSYDVMHNELLHVLKII